MALYILSVNLPKVWSAVVHTNQMNRVMNTMNHALKGHFCHTARFEHDVYITTPDIDNLEIQEKELALVLGYISKDFPNLVWRIRWVYKEYYDGNVITTHEHERILCKRIKTEFI